MDKELIRQRFAKATGSYLEAANVQRITARKLLTLVQKHTRLNEGSHACEIGCGTGLFTRLFMQAYPSCQLFLNDICPEVKDTLIDCLNKNVKFTPGDAELIPLPDKLDVIMSCSVLQWFENPELFIRKCFASLNPGGYLVFATYGQQNLQEITALTDQSLHYHPLEQWSSMVKKYFKIIHTEEELVSLYFKTPIDVLKHFKETGVSGIQRQQWSPGRLTNFCNQYRKKFEDAEGNVPLTYHPLFIICKKQEKI